MIMMKTLFVMLALGVICVGCVSYPFIDDSIAKLDANPVPVKARFDLPETPPLPIAPQNANMLVGDWMTGFHQLACRDIGQDGIIHDYDRKYKGVGEVYAFNADGSYAHNDILQWGGLLIQLKTYGTWAYDSGVLKLHQKNMDIETQDHNAKARGALNWKSNIIKELNQTATRRVEWFAYNEIAIKYNDETSPPQTGSREVVHVDAHGVRIKREIKVLGVKEGREVGTVEETISPPMHFKKKE